MAPPRLTDDTPAYVEYTTQPQDGSVLGVTVSRAAMLGHARTLTAACNYTEGEICVCVLDFKREVRLSSLCFLAHDLNFPPFRPTTRLASGTLSLPPSSTGCTSYSCPTRS